MKQIILLLVVLLLANTNSFASEPKEQGGAMTNKVLLGHCMADRLTPDNTFCLGFIRGSLQQRNIARLLLGGGLMVGLSNGIPEGFEKEDAMAIIDEGVNKLYGCIDAVPFEKAMETYIKWAQANPDRLEAPAALGVLSAMQTAYPTPC